MKVSALVHCRDLHCCAKYVHFWWPSPYLSPTIARGVNDSSHTVAITTTTPPLHVDRALASWITAFSPLSSSSSSSSFLFVSWILVFVDASQFFFCTHTRIRPQNKTRELWKQAENVTYGKGQWNNSNGWFFSFFCVISRQHLLVKNVTQQRQIRKLKSKEAANIYVRRRGCIREKNQLAGPWDNR